MYDTVLLRLRAFADDRRGSPAIEFALVALPLFGTIFVIISVGLYLFTLNALEAAVLQTSRDIRLGRYKATAADMGRIKTSLCDVLPGFVDCTNDVRVILQASPRVANIQEPSCLAKDGAFITEEAARSGSSLGGSSTVVMITLCLRWRLTALTPFIGLGNRPDGTNLMQVTTAFRSEAY